MLSYWFLYGNRDAWEGVMDAPPVTVGKAWDAYRAGQRAGMAGRFYKRHWPR